MNDITKARAFLNAANSDLQHLVSFGLMLATAEQKYRELQLQKQGNKAVPGSLDKKEIDVILEVAVLRYLKRTNRLPHNLPEAFSEGTSLDRKKELAMSWING
jgi:hypothetical protein